MKKDYLSVLDLTQDEAISIINRAVRMKSTGDNSESPLSGKSVGLIFEKSSTRTRVSFEVGIYQLGGQPVTLNTDEIQLGRGETVQDTARTLSRYLSCIAVRTFEHERIEDFASNSTVPVINALTDMHHPCQAMADALTILEKKKTLSGINMAYVGDGNNVANSLIEMAALTGINLRVACPPDYEPEPAILNKARATASSDIKVTNNPQEAAEGVDVVYTDVWVSMGMEEEKKKRERDFEGFEVNTALMQGAKPDAIVMHCLPAYRGKEISAEVLEGPMSVVFDQAENRLHAQKALMEFLLA